MRTTNIICYKHDLDCGIEEGLAKNATDISQIPTFVTAVPNGTEKVWKFKKTHRARLTD